MSEKFYTRKAQASDKLQSKRISRIYLLKVELKWLFRDLRLVDLHFVSLQCWPKINVAKKWTALTGLLEPQAVIKYMEEVIIKIVVCNIKLNT